MLKKVYESLSKKTQKNKKKCQVTVDEDNSDSIDSFMSLLNKETEEIQKASEDNEFEDVISDDSSSIGETSNSSKSWKIGPEQLFPFLQKPF